MGVTSHESRVTSSEEYPWMQGFDAVVDKVIVDDLRSDQALVASDVWACDDREFSNYDGVEIPICSYSHGNVRKYVFGEEIVTNDRLGHPGNDQTIKCMIGAVTASQLMTGGQNV